MRSLLVDLLIAALFAALAGCGPSPAHTSPTPALRVLAATPIPVPSPTSGEPLPPTPRADRFPACVITEQAPAGTLRLVWIEAGDLWVWDREQAEPYSLTDSADLTSVRLTPDTESVVFARQTVTGPELWAVDILGTDPRRLAGGPELTGLIELHSFSPDAELLAFTHRLPAQGGELWAAAMDGSGGRRLVSHPDLMALVSEPLADFAVPSGVTWIPGTHTLTFDAAPGFEEDGIYIYVQRQVQLVDADSGTREILFGPDEGGQVQYSPDGATMAVNTPESLRFMDLGDRSVREAGVEFFATGFGEYYVYPPMVWTPDSQALLLAQPVHDSDAFNTDVSVVIWRVPRDGTPATELAEFSGFVLSFTISPDQAKLAYWRPVAPQSNTRELHIAALDGSTHIIYETGNTLEFRGWAPDSQGFVYSAGGFPGDTRVANICGEPVTLGLDYYPVGLSWLDPNRILFERELPATFELYLVTVGSLELVLNLESFGGYAFAVVAP